MNDREKMLVGAVVLLAVLWGGTQGLSKYRKALEWNQNQQRNIAQKLSDARTATARGRRAQQKLRQWQRESLPSDPEIAKSLYQDWLHQQLTKAGLKVKDLNPLTSRVKSGSYNQLSFVVRAEGKLTGFTDFLYQFYQAKHLHRIIKTDLKPSEDRKELAISFTVDAISLASANRKGELASGTSENIPLPLKDYRDSIGGRNLFAAYKSTKASESNVAIERQQGPSEADQAYVRGIHYGHEGWQVLVRMEKTGKALYFREGDEISIGRFEGTVVKLDGDQRLMIVSAGRRQMQVRLGQSLGEATPLRGRRGPRGPWGPRGPRG